MSSARQASFAGGEVDPLLYGATNHPRYPSALRTLLNFLVAPQGAAKNRPGTKYVSVVKDSTVQPRRIPFLWPSQNYVLEFGNLYVRFISNGGQVLSGGAGSAPLELVTPFTTAMLPYLKYSQKDDILTVSYGGEEPGGTVGVAPREIKRVAHTNWTIGVVSYAALLATWTPSPSLDTTQPQGQQVDATHYGRQWWWSFTRILRNNTTGQVIESAPFNLDLSGLPQWSGIFSYSQGAIVSDGAGGRVWTSKVNANLGNLPATSPTQWESGIVIYPDKSVKLTLGTAAVAGYTLIGVNVFRVQDGTPGWIGFVDASQVGAVATFTDAGQAADFTIQPPKSTDPFATPAGDYPAVVAHFQQRRVFARQPQHLARIQASKTGQASNFDTTIISQDTDALNFDLATSTLDEIRSLVSLKALIALTGTGAVVVRGGQSTQRGIALGPASVDATKQSQRGASWVDPVVVDNVIVFPQAKGSSVRAIVYDPIWETLGQPGNDVALVAQHLLRSRTVVRMAYQEAPDSIIWIVRDDGVLLGLTFVVSANPDQQVYAWHRHTTDGVIEDVCCVPEGTEDAVYLGVKRTINGATVRYTERMASRIVTDIRTAIFLDAALTADGRNVGATTMRATGAAYGGGNEVTITASVASFVADTDLGDAIVFDPDALAGGPFPATIIAYTDPTHVTAQLDVPLAAAFQNVATTSWGWARDSFSGLDHLEGKAVTVLGDGAVQGPFTVSAGMISGLQHVVIAQVGLPYTSDLELLDVKTDSMRTNVKAVSQITAELAESRGFKAGKDFDHLVEQRPRMVTDSWGNPALFTGLSDLTIKTAWDANGRAVIRQTDPLPLTIVAITREVEMGGKP